MKKTYIVVLTLFIIFQGIGFAWAECCCGTSGIPVEGGFPETCSCPSASERDKSDRGSGLIGLDDCGCSIHLVDSDPLPVIISQPFRLGSTFPTGESLAIQTVTTITVPPLSQEALKPQRSPTLQDTKISQAYLCVFLC